MRFDLDLPDLGEAEGYEVSMSVVISARRVPAEDCGTEPYPMPSPEPELPATRLRSRG